MAQLTLFYPFLTMRVLKNYVQSKLIKPVRGRDHHPVISSKEIAMIVYFNKFGNGGFSDRQLRSLRQVIEEEVVTRKEKAVDGQNEGVGAGK